LCPISATKDELFVQNFPEPAKAGLGQNSRPEAKKPACPDFSKNTEPAKAGLDTG
jgi:hypothetical protein